MAVDLEAIARRGRCEASSLKLALPLIEQGYEPPFLARYRRDELGGLDESTLWALKAAVEADTALAEFRDQLHATWQATPLADPAIGDAVRKSGSSRTLQRLSKRLRHESAAGAASDANRLAVRLLNPQKGDSSDPKELADALEDVSDAAAAVEGLSQVVPQRLAGDPRVISAAVRWLSRNAKIHISDVHDPHIGAEQEATNQKEGGKGKKKDEPKPSEGENMVAEQPPAEGTASQVSEPAAAEPLSDGAAVGQDAAPPVDTAPASDAAATDAGGAEASVTETPPAETPTEETPPAAGTPAESAAVPTETTPAAGEIQTVAAESAETTPAESAAPAEASGTTAEAPVAEHASPEPAVTVDSADGEKKPEDLPGFAPDPKSAPTQKQKAKPAPKKAKKISPRQRRRRWLVSVLKPLEGKRMPATKLSAFQIVILGRALRSQVAVCAFEYDAAKLVGEIKKTIVGLNKNIEAMLGDLVMKHEADIREAAETAWWDELHERASTRLVTVVADHLRKHVNRGALESKVVMSIDAVGPKTAATAIVSSDGRVLHGEDVPCQLTGNVRSQTVAKMGELIHQFNVDLVVVSNGPARRACLIALGDLIGQSPEGSLRWTIAERSGADSYSSSNVANSEMRSTPRRFRAAAWIAFSVLHPSQAYAKIDPLRLRLASFQSELSDDALAISLRHIMSSGASRGGVDANAAPMEWLEQLPGMDADVAKRLVKRRESNLLKSRSELAELGWQTGVQSRQALPFLRVYGSEDSLDGTLIHPDDYPLAKKLATALEIELPPAEPPGYQSPSYAKAPEAAEPKLVDATTPESPAPVEDFDRAGEKASEFNLEAATDASQEAGGDAAESSPEAAAEVTTDESASTTPADEAKSDEMAEGSPAETATEESPAEPAAAEPEPAEASSDSGDASAENEAKSATAVEPEAPEPIRRPRPERAKIDKCIKEWQVGRHRVQQLVGWLCDPFGETATSDAPPAVLKTMPTLKTLQPGDQVIGVVVGVMSFGVFVELAPDCSGLIHVSRLSDGYVEDLNETVQVGDVITAWVTGIDEKRRRVGLSTLSPEQEQKLESERQQRPAGRQRGGPPRARGNRGGAREGAAGAAGSQPAARGKSGGGGGGRGNDSRGGGKPRSGGRPGGGKGGRGGGKYGDRGPRKPRKPESYRVVAKAESKPISDAMKKGDEPLRSFGDLMQFYTPENPAPESKPVAKPKQEAAPPAETPAPEVDAAAAPSNPPAPVPAPAETKTPEAPAVGSDATAPANDSGDGSEPSSNENQAGAAE
ncbi:MAG: S1 RNA-binding domain-containing protein [Planctomycetota bacterium]